MNNNKVNTKKIINNNKSAYLYFAYVMEKDKNKKNLILEKIQELKNNGKL